MKKAIILCVILALVGVVSCVPPQADHTPRLAVVISFDQFRGDMPRALEPHLGEGGLARCMREGVSYQHCYYQQANMMTGPGHAVILTGAYPATTGITSNDLCDRALGSCMYCAADTSGVASAFPLLSSTVGDELRARTPESKVIGIANKDRAAILMAGKNPTAVVWVDSKTGTFTTSAAYTTPRWLQSVASKHGLAPYVGTTWEAEIDSARAGRIDNAPWEGTFSDGSRTFPHRLNTIEDAALSPAGVSTLFGAAMDIIAAEKLGADDAPDVLAIGVSTTDYLGHEFGPDSREVQELFVHADREVERLINYLDSTVGRENYVLYITSDHGIAPVPESLNAQVRPGEPRIDAGRIDGKALRAAVEKALSMKYGTPDSARTWIREFYAPSIYLNPATLKERAVDVDSVRMVVVNTIKSIQGIGIAVPSTDLDSNKRPTSIDEATWQYMRNAYHPDRSGDVVIYPKRYWVYGTRATTHGTPHDYDRWVPLIRIGGKTEPSVVSDTVEPTLLAKQLRVLWGL